MSKAVMLSIRPITLRQANDYVEKNHRHHGATAGCKFAVACLRDGEICGVAICGRPVSRRLDDGVTLEINRVCTDGTENACSKLYGACCRIAKEMGYKKVITYILASEDGASVKASNIVDVLINKFNGEDWIPEILKAVAYTADSAEKGYIKLTDILTDIRKKYDFDLR